MKVCVILGGIKGEGEAISTLRPLLNHPQVEKVIALTPFPVSFPGHIDSYVTQEEESFKTIAHLVGSTGADYILWVDARKTDFVFSEAVNRCLGVAEDCGASIVYGDYLEHPNIDYELGSVRDNFDFGPVLFFHRGKLGEALHLGRVSYGFAGLYHLRLHLSRLGPVVHLREPLGKKREGRDYEQEKFSYLDGKGEARQKELEKAVTDHLKEIGAYLPPEFEPLPPDDFPYPVEVSVIIPVKNRVFTVRDAVESALKQKAPFPFNVIVVDNHSTDGTSKLLEDMARRDGRLVVLKPERKEHGIGGCWNEAVSSPFCGKFAVQLDSDDVYAHQDVLQQMVDVFAQGEYAMVIGSYTLVDLEGRVIPPGEISHREWTEENGRNNALRVDGFGAPRAFRTRILRYMPFPDVSYGEDYAVALRISRFYRIGRIYESLYLCRRWEGNSDARPSPEVVNRYNSYKDRVRTMEILARQRLNRCRPQAG